MSYSQLKRDQYGKWKRKINWTKVLFGTFCVVIGGLYFSHVYAKTSSMASSSYHGKQAADSKNSSVDASEKNAGSNCSNIGNGVWNCTDKETLAKWEEYLNQEIQDWKEKAGEPVAVLTRVCRDHGFIDKDCPKILYAMAMQESYFGKVMTGDGGKSHGYYHIMYYNNVSNGCANDLQCSATWSLERMIRYGFGKNRDVAIMAHNGTPGTHTTLAYLNQVKNKMKLLK